MITIGDKINLVKDFHDRRNKLAYAKGTPVIVRGKAAENIYSVEVQLSNRKIVLMPESFLTEVAA